ncbi:NADAR family protein [Paludisphaera mucosa]|uniref:NADAR family protein n=1 Tax=Paludisphaera mucosa TaxID=3030827 RepID=A0ABT6FHM2_9BACT|nr:NADAR family protein [Paludisphaera mucosa]MDG3007072.1 NADAR family protein [Paludisphaera mucosa]
MAIWFSSKSPDFGWLSNFSAHAFSLDDRLWPTVEHYFQARKFADREIQEHIRAAKTPQQARKMGRDRSLPIRPDWEEVKVDVMTRVLRAKFSQHPRLKAALLATGDAPLLHESTRDHFWGCNRAGKGGNRLGRILMDLRESFGRPGRDRRPPTSDAEWLAHERSYELLEFLGPQVGERELRAVAAACCRRIWPHLEERSRQGVEAVEDWLDGRVPEERRREAARSAAQAFADAARALDVGKKNGHLFHAARAAAACCWHPEVAIEAAAGIEPVPIDGPFDAAMTALVEAATAQAVGAVQEVGPVATMHDRLHEEMDFEYAEQAAIVRRILANPFRPR